MSLELWTLPEYYVGESWPEYYVFLNQTRDSDCLTQSNFRVALKRLGGESETVLVVCENHFLCGWVEWIAIHKDDGNAIKLAEEMQEKIENYPILDEDDCVELENETASDHWKTFSNSERISYIKKRRNQFEFSDFADMLACCRGKYFAGYVSEFLA